jgi:RimJ/RimL family protein N-acetyltransferase
MTGAPHLKTERLVLRKHAIEDFAALHAMWTEPAVYRYITGHPSTREESWSRLMRYLGHWTLLGYGYWAVEEQVSGAFVGEMGFADYRREIDPPFGDRPELGWILRTNAHGKGYATEALTAIAAWGDIHFGKRETACMIAPENAPSIRVAEKIGFHEELRTTYKGEPSVVFYRAPKS